jgi:protein-tyrosine phosphatase
MSRVDLHFHLLPGVDDGPADMETSLELARAAVADGSTTVVATPHVRADLGLTDAVEIHARVLELRAALAAAGIQLEVRCGGELGHDVIAGMRQGELELLAQGPPRGFGVLIAHPERSADAILDGCAGLSRELESGSLAQLNAQSLTGDHGEEACGAAWELIAGGQISVVASDAHGLTRPPALSLARRTLLGVGLSAPAADALTAVNPRRLLGAGIPSRQRPIAA